MGCREEDVPNEESEGGFESFSISVSNESFLPNGSFSGSGSNLRVVGRLLKADDLAGFGIFRG